MPRIFKAEVEPVDGQVSLLHAAWQDYPEFDATNEWVAFKAQSLIEPDSAPYPGFAVATRSAIGPEGPRTVLVEVWVDEVPGGLHRVRESVLSSGDVGVEIFDGVRNLRLKLPSDTLPIEIWVDADAPERVAHVAFVLTLDSDARRRAALRSIGREAEEAGIYD